MAAKQTTWDLILTTAGQNDWTVVSLLDPSGALRLARGGSVISIYFSTRGQVSRAFIAGDRIDGPGKAGRVLACLSA